MRNLDDLLLFRDVALHRSFTKTAAVHGLSRSVVSKRLTRLEEQLGVRLLNRSTRQISLTEAGELLSVRCAELSSAIDSAEQAVRQLTRHAVGELRVSAPVFLGHQLVAYLERELLRSNPQLKLNLELDDARVDIIGRGYDAAVRIGQEPSPNLASERIGATRVVVCATPAFLAAHDRPASPEALSAFPCIMQATGLSASNQWDFVTERGPLTVTVDGPFRSNNDFALRDAALASLGIAYIPSFVVAPELASGELISVLDEYSPRERQIYLVYPHQPHLPRKVTALRELLPGVMRSLGLG